MTGFKKTATVILLAGLCFTGTSQASLVARAGGMVYDNVNNITWAADANLFQTQAASNTNLVSQIMTANGGVIHDTPNVYDTLANSGIHNLTSKDFNTGSGQMSWFGAQAWANNLTLGDVKGWSLPGTPVEASGRNVTSSPMGDLFYSQLGGVAGSSIVTTHNTYYDLFSNVQTTMYWSGSEYGLLSSVFGHPSDGRFAWVFATSDGSQGIHDKVDPFYAWAVHAGDVAAVPVPGAVWLFGSGLIGLVSFTHRKNKAINLIAA